MSLRPEGMPQRGGYHNELMLRAAVEHARHHWKVFPLSGKVPMIPGAHRKGAALGGFGCCVQPWDSWPDPYYGKRCRGECGQLGHGVYDATDDVEVVTSWWTHRYRDANIGAAIPPSMLMVEYDPRHGGDRTWARLLDEHPDEPWPECLTTISGRGDGGRHMYVRRPPGRITAERLGPGIDLKAAGGYAVMAPSVHPDTGGRYQRIDGPVPAPPAWFADLVTAVPSATVRAPRRAGHRSSGVRRCAASSSSPAEAFNEQSSWDDILTPHGWECLDCDPDAGSARWLHPDATSACSATVRHGCLFVYSPNTPFEVTEAGNPRGYTKFRAWAVLNHNGDLSAAARFVMREMTR